MNQILRSVAATGLSLILIATIATPVSAATRNYSYSSEGTSDYWRAAFQNATSTQAYRRSLPSPAQQAIQALPSQAVQDLPIPVLFGVSVSDLSPNFGDPRDGGARTHEGEDIMAPKDDPIVSPTDAVVLQVGTGSSAGNYVYTANPGGETFAYMHLDKFADNLKIGDVLKQGDLIGYVGNTGDAAGGATHLHFEVRRDRTPTDPFPRLTREFTNAERMTYTAAILANAGNQNLVAQDLATNYRSTFVAAQLQGIAIPGAVQAVLGTPRVVTATGFSRDLTIGSRGDDVTSLQLFLINKNVGSKAVTLAATGATGYFGVLTQAALAEYQAANGIAPSVGYFGPITRAQIALKVAGS